MIDLSTSLKYYKREDIQKAIAREAENKEVGVYISRANTFGKRPDSIMYPSDVLEFAKKGVSSFHFSEELWENPLALKSDMKKKEMDSLRIGWDLVIDIDALYEFSQVCAYVIAKALDYHGIKHYGVKYSGNKGFHIGIPFECFPKKVNDVELKDLFPEGAIRVAMYLKEFIRKNLAKELLKKFTLEEIKKKTGMSHKKLVITGELDPFAFIEIDTILISSRHLYRAPYSLHEKSGLASIPLNKKKIMEFDLNTANPKKVVVGKEVFLDRKHAIKGEANELFIKAFDFKPKVREEKIKKKVNYDELETDVIPEEFFPPCIKKGLEGLNDGRKRFVFTLINFLNLSGRSFEEVEKIVNEWNEKNSPPLKKGYLDSQLKYRKTRAKAPPPNCSSKNYYVELGICHPDSLCEKIKNPLSYSRRRMWANKSNKKTKTLKQRIKKASRQLVHQKIEENTFKSGQEVDKKNNYKK